MIAATRHAKAAASDLGRPSMRRPSFGPHRRLTGSGDNPWHMKLPIVIELPPAFEPVVPDPFLADFAVEPRAALIAAPIARRRGLRWELRA